MKPSTLRDNAYLTIKEMLFERDSGDFLSIRQCAAKFGMSYTPVREAFRRLEQEGFLRQIPGVGYFVQKPDYIDFLQMYQVRKCIEPFTFGQVFSRISEVDIRELTEMDQKIDEALVNQNWEASLKLDIQFHGFFVRKYQNAYLEDVYFNVRGRYQSFMIKNLHAFDEKKELGDNGRHDAWIRTIEQGDLRQALVLLNAHIDDGYARMTQRVQQSI